MSTIKNPTRFAELEYCLQGYFDGKLAPVMKQVRDDLTHKQLEERGRYQSSLAGVLASANPYADNTEFVLKQTGKWNSKTTEDYLAMCNQKIWKDKNIVKDLALLAGEWRNAVVKEIGRSKYDALSKACGEDLAGGPPDFSQTARYQPPPAFLCDPHQFRRRAVVLREHHHPVC